MNEKFTIHMNCDMIVESDQKLSERFQILETKIKEALCHMPFIIKSIRFETDILDEFENLKKDISQFKNFVI